MIKYIIQKLFCKKIRLTTVPPQRMVRIFLAIQYKTDKSKYMVYIDGKKTELIIDHSQIIGLLTRNQYRDFITKDETIFLVPYNKLVGNNEPEQKLKGRKTNSDAFNIKNGLIK